MSPVPTAAPPLPADLEALMRQLKMPHARALAPDLLITARTQRWEPTEVLKALLDRANRTSPRRPCSIYSPQGMRHSESGRTYGNLSWIRRAHAQNPRDGHR